MNEIQRYTLTVGKCVDGPCICETTDNPNGRYMRSEDVEAELEASPWIPVSERLPVDHHPGYLVRGLDDIPHKAYWDHDHWIYEGARFEANAFLDWMEIPE